MRFAIFSDIHGNLEALEAVLSDARERHCTHFVCLGDVVGYNANPRECVEIVRDLDCPTVKGNHDEQASQPEASGDFNEMAERAMTWTRAQLSEKDREWLRDLRLQRQVRDFTIVHATLDTPAQWGYVFRDLDAAASFTYNTPPFVFLVTPIFNALLFGTSAPAALSRNKFTSNLAKNILLTPAVSANRVMVIGAPPIASTTPMKI